MPGRAAGWSSSRSSTGAGVSRAVRSPNGSPGAARGVRARLAPEDGALFVRVLEASRERLAEREPSAERGSAEPRRPTAAEALLAMAEASLAGRVDRSGGERYQVVVHVDAGEGGSTLEDGPALAPGDCRAACLRHLG